MKPKEAAALLVLSALWGGSFLFMRVAAPVLGPVWLIELRVAVAGVALLGYAAASGRTDELRLRMPLSRFIMVGIINSALPFLLISTAELRITASMAATLNAMTPLFGLLVSAWWLGERITAVKAVALIAGILGVAALVGLNPIPLTAPIVLSIGASLVAALCYGIAAVYIKARLSGAGTLALATHSQLAAAVLLLPLVPFAPPHAAVTSAALLCALALALLSTALGYLLYFYLIVSAGPTKATTVTLLSPAFGVVWGALFLSEPVTPSAIVGLALILVSVALVLRPSRRATERSV